MAAKSLSRLRQDLELTRSDVPLIHFDYYCLRELNGQARKTDDGFFIGFSSDIYEKLANLFCALVFLPGNRIVRTLDSYRDGAVPTQSEKALKANYSFMLATLARDLLFDHEMAHVCNGHLDYLSRAKDSGKNVSVNVCQTLEWDADCQASARGLLGIAGRLSSPRKAGADELGFGTPKAALFSLAFSIYVLFRSLASSGPIFEGLDKRDHPPPQLRAAWCLATIATGLQPGVNALPVTDEVKKLLDDAFPVVTEAMVCAERGLAEARTVAVDTGPLLQTLDAESSRLLGVYRRTWAEIRDELQALALNPRLAPAVVPYPSVPRAWTSAT